MVISFHQQVALWVMWNNMFLRSELSHVEEIVLKYFVIHALEKNYLLS